MKHYISLDIGATKIAAALISKNKIIKKTKLLTEPQKGQAKVLQNIIKAIEEINSSKVKGIGIGIAGQVDQKNGVVISSPNFGRKFKNVNLKKILQTNFKKPVEVENDANCFVLGEAIYGVGKGYDYVIGLTLGTGIGGGIVINQQIYHGKEGLAGELGHTTIIKNGLTCSCGQKGHLEAYASGTAMKKLYQNITGQKRDALTVEELAKQGDKQAQQVFKIMSEALANGLANFANIFNPDIIVLGGGVAKVKILTEPTIKLFASKVVYPRLTKTKIVISKLKSDAALLGATLLLKK